MLKATEQAKKREKIARYSQEDLEQEPVSFLRELGAGIVPNAPRLKKKVLIAELIAATQAERVIVGLIPDTPLDAIAITKDVADQFEENVNQQLGEWTEKFYEEFRKLVQSKWRGADGWDESIHGDLASMGYRVVRYLDEYEGRGGENLKFTTKLRYRTRIWELLEEFVQAEEGAVYYKQLESCLELLRRAIKIQISETANLKKNLQERKLAQRKKDKVTVSFKPLHEFSLKTLQNLEKFSSRDWKRISIALVIASGRRLSEIHLTTTKFEYVDSFKVSFTGQLKVKGKAAKYYEDNPAYEIPTLVNAELVVKGHDWLKRNNKTVNTPDLANRRYSGDLSDAVRMLRSRWDVQHECFTYKGFRAIYGQVCNQVFNNNNQDNVLYLAEILGHGRGDLIDGDDLTDMLTPQSYNSDFEVVDTDCVLS
ncbi:telomere resolvase [Aetokthonos hydrillicola Thurmond2011]|jgi:hypothetical protein|uniref:Telomere resolvase n=1 Tax=Aetokthonos hydrillicola Thurmond2011 TaxID=2712845 RepID=A0AAP5IHD4_9CYAN|nr:protelomerase family protein [Aetokthonos hydrillicola]MBW4591147.1 telomere resolvase [Aetokthonos hydrillicola CCALA 1050]MDR9900909.1 telomere resolvase [Aetokthonos hydrillicola Thurmond2011]